MPSRVAHRARPDERKTHEHHSDRYDVDWATHAARIGQVGTAVIVAWITFAVLGDLETNGLHLMVLGVLRMALLAILVAFVAVAGVRSRLGRIGLGLAAVMADLEPRRRGRRGGHRRPGLQPVPGHDRPVAAVVRRT